MAAEINTYVPNPERLIKFIKLQVTDALLNEEIFEGEAAEKHAPLLFALALLTSVPPVPANRGLLDDTFGYMQRNLVQAGPGQLTYADVAKHYNRLLPVFQKSAALPPHTPMSNPYEEIAKVAAYDLGFADDGIRLFNLTLWLTHYCKDALAMFFTENLPNTRLQRPGQMRSLPAPAEAYEFVSAHVNNAVGDTTFFPEGAPSNATEVLTGLFLFFALLLPTQNNSLLLQTLDYTNQILSANNFSLLFFDRIVNVVERLSAVYNANPKTNDFLPTYYSVDKMVDESLKIMGNYPNTTLKMNIVSYLSALINDAFATLYPEAM